MNALAALTLKWIISLSKCRSDNSYHDKPLVFTLKIMSTFVIRFQLFWILLFISIFIFSWFWPGWRKDLPFILIKIYKFVFLPSKNNHVILELLNSTPTLSTWTNRVPCFPQGQDICIVVHGPLMNIVILCRLVILEWLIPEMLGVFL